MQKEGYIYKVYVVDDGSKDKTAEIAGNYSNNVFLLSQPKNMGKGAAVRRGMLDSDGDIKLFSDADLSTPIYEIKKIIAAIEEGYQVAIGSRAIDHSMIKKHQPIYRELMGKIFNLFVQALVFPGIKDTQCGFKGFTTKAAEIIFSKALIDGFGFDVEILYIARKNGLATKEIAVEWFNDERSKVNPISDSAKMFSDILKVRKLHK